MGCENTAIFCCYWLKKARKQGVELPLEPEVRRVAEKLIKLYRMGKAEEKAQQESDRKE